MKQLLLMLTLAVMSTSVFAAAEGTLKTLEQKSCGAPILVDSSDGRYVFYTHTMDAIKGSKSGLTSVVRLDIRTGQYVYQFTLQGADAESRLLKMLAAIC